MIPWAHAGIGYLLWSGSTHYYEERPPGDVEVWLLLLGTQFPDLVDKPLAWSVGVLPSGRSLGHSLLTVTVLFVILYAVARRRDQRTLAVAFTVGHLSHSLADTVNPLLEGRYGYLDYLLWPLLGGPKSELNRSIVEHFLSIRPSDLLGVQSLIALLVIVLWVHDGMPGLPTQKLWSGEDDADRE